MDSEPVLHYKDLISSKNQHHFSYLEIKDDEQTLVKLLEQGNVDLLAVSVSKFFRKIKSNFNIENGKNIVIELMVLVLSASYRNGIEEASAGYTTYLSDIKRINDWRQLETWSIRRMTLISEKIQFKKTAHVSNVVLKAKEFIDSNYKDDISLNEISKYVSVSPQYFSTIFKEELGMNFVEYLRGKRVDVAKELLKTKKYSVKEICYEVGYNDPNYFSRLFKKIVGVSPTEYK
jgi:two-component system response regulator YesN